jgi:hypothetical protein
VLDIAVLDIAVLDIAVLDIAVLDIAVLDIAVLDIAVLDIAVLDITVITAGLTRPLGPPPAPLAPPDPQFALILFTPHSRSLPLPPPSLCISSICCPSLSQRSTHRG